MQLTNPGLANLRKEAAASAAQPSDWTYWIQKGLSLLGSANPMGGATMALQGAMPQAEASTSVSKTSGTGLDVMMVLAALVPLTLGRSGGKAQQEAIDVARQLIKKWGLQPDDTLRLFRGAEHPYSATQIPGTPLELDETARKVQGLWYTPDPGYALHYTDNTTGPLWKVDVPKAEAEQFWLPNQPQEVRQHSPYWTREYVVSPEVAARATPAMPYTSKQPPGLANRLSEVYGAERGFPEPMELDDLLRSAGWGKRLDRAEDVGRQFAEPQAGPDWIEMLRGLVKEMDLLK
jgi:hypothetical protein